MIKRQDEDLLRPGATNQQKVAREEDEAEKEIAVPTSVSHRVRLRRHKLAETTFRIWPIVRKMEFYRAENENYIRHVIWRRKHEPARPKKIRQRPHRRGTTIERDKTKNLNNLYRRLQLYPPEHRDNNELGESNPVRSFSPRVRATGHVTTIIHRLFENRRIILVPECQSFVIDGVWIVHGDVLIDDADTGLFLGIRFPLWLTWIASLGEASQHRHHHVGHPLVRIYPLNGAASRWKPPNERQLKHVRDSGPFRYILGHQRRLRPVVESINDIRSRVFACQSQKRPSNVKILKYLGLLNSNNLKIVKTILISSNATLKFKFKGKKEYDKWRDSATVVGQGAVRTESDEGSFVTGLSTRSQIRVSPTDKIGTIESYGACVLLFVIRLKYHILLRLSCSNVPMCDSDVCISA
ncbi:hypothetical protein WN51_05171 [Melipona quadrifasciata]|uniref:Uncharacterized protein n=1 Tax=Melipona quadrifasciata TaxID=166423 RepID=A0A0M8ZTF2_9HYME|nr:hypothetical protein WN51_05171 [Melipona quadrifasciata]